MRVLFISGELIAGDLPCRLRLEGCEVKLFIEHSDQQDCLNGFVTKVQNWRQELEWVGKDGLIVFDDVGYGAIQDELRRQKFRVFGGSEGGDRLELDREFAQNLFASFGLEVLPTARFQEPADAAHYIRNTEPCRWVVKQNEHDSSLCYVGQLDDGSDVIEILQCYQDKGVRNVSLQEVAQGVEFAVGRFFNGNDWIGPIELNIEHKSLCDGDIGPLTGEMGNLAWFTTDEEQPLFKEVLAPLKSYLVASGFRGNVDVNCIINSKQVIPIEITARLGCPAVHIHDAMFLTPWRDILCAIADSKQIVIAHRQGYGIGLTMAVPPFPYQGEIDERYSSVGYPVHFRTEVSEEARNFHYHFESVQRAELADGRQIMKVTRGLGVAAFVTGTGMTVQSAREDTYKAAENLCIPKVIYRRDIGEKFLREDGAKLRSWGWL
ncbi:MAG: hypothetical protein Q7V56_04165 [Gammaproteobacteria bacterium]|nr:hypothetical protein [Gammaproteobacteria bacterium]